jgi:lipopolysaccharide transport system ATP-binding protein
MSSEPAPAAAEQRAPNSDLRPVVVHVHDVAKAYAIWSSPKARLAHGLVTMAGRLPLARLGLAKLAARTRQMHREFHALQDISFEIRKGESWGFIGVNGSGKSTLLKIISGNLRHTHGFVEVEGKVAILDYSSGINGEFTGRENVYLKAAILGLTRRQIDERFESIAAFADIGDFIDQPVKTYSSGMAARLGFAIMAHVDADILITDEALAVGDAFFVQKCMAYVRTFLRKGTFLFVSHAVNDVVALCEKAVWLDHGRIQRIGSAREVTDAYLSSASLKHSQKYLEDRDERDRGDAEPAPRGDRRRSAELQQPQLSAPMHSRPPRVVKDPRLEFVNRSRWRNDIEIPEFAPPSTGFGVGGARIVDVSFEDDAGALLTWIIGAEVVRLLIDVEAERDLTSPIVGFQVKDRLGQPLFADNTFLATVEQPLVIPAGRRFRAEFCFQMPLLPVGEYVVRAAVALGSESDNAMLHCIDDALLFRSVSSGARHGLVGVPMLSVKLSLAEGD